MERGRKKTTEELQTWLSQHLPFIKLESAQDYKNNKFPLDFECFQHGKFTTTWNQITRGSHCPQCGVERLKLKTKSRRTLIDDIIKRINNVHGNHIKVLNPQDYQHQHSRLNFQCRKGHEWDVRVYTVVQGSGCPKCAGKNITTVEFCENLKEVHNDKLTLVEGQEYLGRKHLLNFKCQSPLHLPFSASPSNVIFRKSGCPECKKDRLREVFRYTADDVYKIIESRSYNFRPLPNQEYTNQDSVWKFACGNPEHPIWEAPLGAYIQGTIKFGCTLCSGVKPVGSLEDIHALCSELFRDKVVLLDSKVPVRIIKNTTNFNFLCRKHSVKFNTTLSLLSNSKGCQKCSLESYSAKRRTSLEDLINQVKLIHRDFILVEDASLYENTESKILFRCIKSPKHGVFKASTHDILAGGGCPICRMSKGERKIWFWLNDHKITFISQKRVSKHIGSGVFIFDFFLPEERLIIEYDGRQHTTPIERWGGGKGLLKTQENDKLKNEYAQIINFEMLRIPYTEFDSIDEILEDKLSRVGKS